MVFRHKLRESIEVHETLNPLLWNSDNTLKTDIGEALQAIVLQYIDDSEVLKESDIIDIELLGSNASYNYTKDSDLDLHIVVNMEAISSDPTLVQIACNAEKSIFNKAYNITVKGVDVELYVEDVNAATASNGIYSLTKNEWIRFPIRMDIPDLTNNPDYNVLLGEWVKAAKDILNNSSSSSEITRFINEIYNLRRLSIMTEGEYGIGNLVFKEVRNRGLLQQLKDMLNLMSSRELSLEGLY